MKPKPKNRITKPPSQPHATASKTQTVISVPFLATHEIHDREQYQNHSGRFLPGLTDTQGYRREWRGKIVHALQLNHRDKQILRVLSDSQQDAERLLSQCIQDEFFRLAGNEETAKFQYDAFIRISFEHGLMMKALERVAPDTLREISQTPSPKWSE